MSYARFAQTISPLAYRPPPLPKTKPKADHGVYFGRKYRLIGVSYVFVPDHFADDDCLTVRGIATPVGGGSPVRNVTWNVNKMELIDE